VQQVADDREGNSHAEPDRDEENPFIDLLHQSLNVHSLKIWHDDLLSVGVCWFKCANQCRSIEIRLRAERRLGEMMAEQPKATGGYQYTSKRTRVPETPVLASQGIDKNLAHCAMISKRVHADWWDMQAEVGLFLMGAGTALILVALIGLIWSMVPR
jgi:hypothetical protein